MNIVLGVREVGEIVCFGDRAVLTVDVFVVVALVFVSGMRDKFGVRMSGG